jgi:hypothetical protein
MLAVSFGIAFPCIFFVVPALDVLELESAFKLATWSGSD